MHQLETTIAPVEPDTESNCDASVFVNQYAQLYEQAIEGKDLEALEILDKKTRQWVLALQASVSGIKGEKLRNDSYQQAIRAQHERVQQATRMACEEKETIKACIGSSKRAKHYTLT